MYEIADYLWRLLPANPILLRVVQMNGKRRRDLFIRCIYLGLLIAIVLFSIPWSTTGTGNLSELAKTSATLFQFLSYCQLGGVALLAPIFTAGAITQEKDSQTYDILLATPLTNGQILLGSLMSRLFFVIALLISGIPIFSITQIFGGVAISGIVQSFFLAAATALVTGAIAMAIAVLKVGTRRTIFSFYLFIVMYMVGTYVLDQLDFFKIGVLNPANNAIELSKTSWMTAFNPFLALRTLFHDSNYMPPDIGDLPAGLQRWPLGWMLSNPANFYITFMFFISFVLISPSVVLLRRLAQSTTSLRSVVLRKLHISSGDRTRKPRAVWTNPIAWREARTKASAARATLMRYGFMGGGLIGAIGVLVMFCSYQAPASPDYIDAGSYNPALNQLSVYNADGSVRTKPVAKDVAIRYTDPDNPQSANPDNPDNSINGIGDLMSRITSGRVAVVAQARTDANGTEREWTDLNAVPVSRKLSAADARKALLGLTAVEFAVILLIVTNAAASTVTREKEDGTLDLLLSTPITSRYYIWGKLRGLVSMVLPLVAVPVASAAIFVIFDSFRLLTSHDARFQWLVFPEAVVLLPAMLIIVVAFASILGMNMSLRLRKTVVAVMSSIGIIVGICAAMGWCGYKALDSGTEVFSYAASAFSPFTLLTVMIDPYAFSNRLFDDQNGPTTRTVIFILAWVAIGVYTAAVFTMHKSMVKNFDMTIRKQSR